MERHDKYTGYLKLGSKPDPDENVLVKFYYEASDPINAAQAIAAESSVGTWTKLSTMKQSIREKLQANVYSLDKKKKIVKIAYPLELFEPANIPQLLSDIAGNIYGMLEVKNIRLVDFELPKKYVKSFKGPKIGMPGVRKMMKTDKEKRPHLGTIVKPKVGLSPEENAKVAYEAWTGGVDFVKDDENLSSQSFCRFEDRIIKTLEAKDKAEEETGRKKMYAANITAPTDTMLKRAEFVKDHGGNCIMVDIVTAGFAALQTVRDRDYGLPIHAHRAMYAAFARNPRHGFSMLALAKLARLAGVDQLHTGAIVGKMEASEKEVLAINKNITSEWFGLKPVFPVASGGIDPTRVPKLLSIAGTDLVINAGGGIHGHPHGTLEGAKALRQSVDSWLAKKTLKQYAETHPELKLALQKWG